MADDGRCIDPQGGGAEVLEGATEVGGGNAAEGTREDAPLAAPEVPVKCMGSEPPVGSRPIVDFERHVGAYAMAFPHLFVRNARADITYPRPTSVNGVMDWMGYLLRYCWQPAQSAALDGVTRQREEVAKQSVPEALRPRREPSPPLSYLEVLTRTLSAARQAEQNTASNVLSVTGWYS